MAFRLTDLPYAYDALAPFGMSEETVRIHHDRHHRTYVDSLNKAIAGTGWDDLNLEEIVTSSYEKDAVAQSAIFNNASQHWNHTLFWQLIGPGESKLPGELERTLTDSFGSFAAFRQQFVANGVAQFGSGWVWLVKDQKSGRLEIVKTGNGVDPLCFGQKTLLGCDVWEHSYYIDYRNQRPAYLENFLDRLVDWETVAARL